VGGFCFNRLALAGSIRPCAAAHWLLVETTAYMKLLILTIIVLAVPMFFVFVFVMSTVSNLTSLRNRCREIRESIQAAPAVDPQTGPVLERRALGDFNLAAERYNAARTKFPGNLLAALCGFHEMETLPDPPVNYRSEAP
jgi:hypothetical protein